MTSGYSAEDVAEVVENYGLGYAVLSCLSVDSIADPELATLWRAAQEALEDIERVLKKIYEGDRK